jgi:endonuclease YncB( thermonuclease family)
VPIGLPSALAPDFSGPVVSILDGDTIDVLHNGHAERICLSGIDCPEKGPSYESEQNELPLSS